MAQSCIIQAPGGCQCSGGGSGLLWFVSGCDGSGVTGCLIDVWTSSSKTFYLGQAIDDGGGNYSIAGAPAGSRYIEITPPTARFALRTETFAYTSGVRHTVALAAAAGYVCASCCAYPIPKNLPITDACNAGTLVWDSVSSSWLSGWFTVSKSSYKLVNHGINNSCDPVTGDVCYSYKLVCQTSPSLKWVLTRTWYEYDTTGFGGPYAFCSDPCASPHCYANSPFVTAGGASSTSWTPSTPCYPLALSGSLTQTIGHSPPGDPCPGSVAVTE